MPKHKIGYLHPGSKGSFVKPFAAFVNRLEEIVGERKVKIFEIWAADETGAVTLNDYADRLIARKLDAIVAAGGPSSAIALKDRTLVLPPAQRTPVIFTAVTAPVDLGLVTNLEEPGGNVTGIAGLTSELDPPRLRILAEVVRAQGGVNPRIGVLNNAARPGLPAQYAMLVAEAASLGIPLVRKDVLDLTQIRAAFTAFKTLGADQVQGVLVTADPLFNNLRSEVVVLARGIPAIYQWREFPELGGLMSYGPNISDAYEMAAEYVADILEGDKPADMPVSVPDRFELVLNMKVANKEGFKIPPSVLTRAEFIEHRRKRANRAPKPDASAVQR
jgi:putative ABC transport system substrate-binding protein